MRVLIVNTSQYRGGAAVAAGRLLNALNKHGVKAQMLVRNKQTSDLCVSTLPPSRLDGLRFLWERLIIWARNGFSRRRLFAVSIANTGRDITRQPEFQAADIIHLHWVNHGMLSLTDLRRILDSGKPVVWTLHDMWPITGICHHAGPCTAYRSECHHCPMLGSQGGRHDLSQRVFERKRAVYAHGSIAWVACSRWLMERARASALPHEQATVVSIPNPIDTLRFRPQDRARARATLGLPPDAPLILFGSVKTTDPRKGFEHLIQACRLLEQRPFHTRPQLVIFGQGTRQLLPLMPLPTHALPYIDSEQALIDLYNAVDVFVTPSLEENLPNMIMEAMSCGLPCVGFDTGGIPEMIDHLQNGYVATYASSDDLAEGIAWVLTHDNRARLGQEAVSKVKRCYSEQVVARAYIQLYRQIAPHHAP